MNKISQLFKTVIHLKNKQIIYRFYNILRSQFRRFNRFKYPLSIPSRSYNLVLQPSISNKISYSNRTFTFLNISHKFLDKIDWNYMAYEQSWTYNLTYFDYLLQKTISEADALSLINDFIDSASSHIYALDPFPISIRGINWIKFFSYESITNTKINNSLFAQYHILVDNLEYHLLGNHLLENGFSLLFGAYYFQSEQFYVLAKKILSEELEEQILADGAHFELSPMYHQIMFFRVLDCINLVKNNSWKNHELLALLTNKATIMLGWLKTITYQDGSIPLFNDSANGIAPSSQDLFTYAHLLGISPLILPLKESGYRKIVKGDYECIIDVGNIGPDYIPGHAHSDTFNFELYINGKPYIVDTGTSTYTDIQRLFERSTFSHNTVVINNKDQSKVWGRFRVAERAKIIHLLEQNNIIEATHDGYLDIATLHTRRFSFDANNIKIEDIIQSKKSNQAIAYLHCHPSVTVTIDDGTIRLNDVTIRYSNHSSLTLNTYNYAPEFNTLIPATVIECTFQKTLNMEIIL